MMVEVTRAVLARILDEAALAHPHECCGILLGDAQTIRALKPATNIHSAPDRHFEIDPRALVDAHRAARAGGPAVVGYYHSHPVGQAVPSSVDRALAAHDGRIWAIAAEGEVRFWQDDEAGFEALSLRVIDR